MVYTQNYALQVVATLDTLDGGPAHNAAGLNAAFGRSGHAVPLYVWRRPGATQVKTDWSLPSGPVHRTGFGYAWIRDLWKDAASSRFVILHGYYLPHAVLVALVCALLGKRLVCVPHGTFTTYQDSKSRVKKRLFDAVLGKIIRIPLAAFATGSDSEARTVSSKFGIPSVTTGVGIDVSDCDLDRTWGDPPILLSISRLSPKKRIDLTIMAVADFNRRHETKCKLTIAGDGQNGFKSALQDVADKSEISPAWLGSVTGNAKSDLYRNSDIMILCSEDENFGITVIESLAHGCPVITTDRVASSSYVLRSGAGIVLRDADPEKVSEAISTLLASETPRGDLAKSAQDLVRSELGWSTVVERWDELWSMLTEVKTR